VKSVPLDVVESFEFDGQFEDAGPYGIGHIHDTYLAHFRARNGRRRRYILQRINHRVFLRPDLLMENIQAVTAHLREKIVAAGGDPRRETLNLIPTVEGHTFRRTADGSYWRAYLFVNGAQTYEVAHSLEHVYSAAKAFGTFQKLLEDFPADRLHETIPGFHDTRKRFAAFVEAVERDVANRARLVQREIAFVERRAADTSVLVDLVEQGRLPARVTHNDTKFNNVMIDDETGEGICVIDLDTVMPGLSLYDFGDSIRSGANPAAEDERDLAKVYLDLEIFDHFVRGYLEAVLDSLTSLEVDYLPFSAKLMTFECGMRFLADFLDGDTYFKVHRENHNLDRARAQLKLVQDMEHKMDRMSEVVARYR
jgi:Ser/Thr protein kinase RdoA (MazF antagonist)